MEDTLVKSLKPVAVLSAAAASALVLVGCSAGQITQTSSQVAAVDGATAFTEDGALSVQDVTIVLDENGKAALKFVATNQDTAMTEHRLVSADVNGKQVKMDRANAIAYNCAVVGDSKDGLERMPQLNNGCTQYVTTTVDNDDFAYGGNVDVKFTFDTGDVDVTATVSAPNLPAGEVDRDFAR